MPDAGVERAAAAIARADALLIGAGAGMSVDAGIPAYRLNPPNERGVAPAPLGALIPLLFRSEPELAWGRAVQQLDQFRRATPHRGYEVLRRWSRRMRSGAFVLTSNVDGMFQAAGFPGDNILEGHGSMHFVQCTRACTQRVWRIDESALPVVSKTGYASPPLPRCPDCGDDARPNVFMFGDQHFNGERAEAQGRSLEAWLTRARGQRFVVIECGAGTAVPTIRQKCQAYAQELSAPLVRINVAESHADDGVIRLPLRAEVALERIDALLSRQ